MMSWLMWLLQLVLGMWRQCNVGIIFIVDVSRVDENVVDENRIGVDVDCSCIIRIAHDITGNVRRPNQL